MNDVRFREILFGMGEGVDDNGLSGTANPGPRPDGVPDSGLPPEKEKKASGGGNLILGDSPNIPGIPDPGIK